jgi:hypothetical protein
LHTILTHRHRSSSCCGKGCTRVSTVRVRSKRNNGGAVERKTVLSLWNRIAHSLFVVVLRMRMHCDGCCLNGSCRSATSPIDYSAFAESDSAGSRRMNVDHQPTNRTRVHSTSKYSARSVVEPIIFQLTWKISGFIVLYCGILDYCCPGRTNLAFRFICAHSTQCGASNMQYAI